VVSACVAIARQLPGTAAAQGGPLQSYRTGEPVTSSECERTHCKVVRVKSAARCSMTDDRWEHLVILVLVEVEQKTQAVLILRHIRHV